MQSVRRWVKQRRKKQLAGYILNCSGDELELLQDMIMERRRELYPEWEYVDLSLPKEDKKERSRLVKELERILLELS